MPIIAVAGDNEAPKIVTGVPQFSKQIIDNTMKETHFAVPGDFDLDGDTDVVATNYLDDTVAWYENNGSNGFTKHVIDSNLDGAYPVHVADMNRDGALDVLATGYLADAIVWYENNGTGVFTRHIIDSNSNGAHSVYATDLDGDNDTDVVTSSQDANTIVWYENDGSSNFMYHLIENNAIGAKYAFAADLDGDNDIDIATASFFDTTIAWYENDGQQNFHEITIDTQADGAYYVHGTDLDGDGDSDLVSASQNNNMIAWYENNGYGGFTRRVIDNGAQGARAVFSDDVDNDGDTDVLSASVNDDTIAWYRNDGRGIFIKQPIDITTGGAYGVSPANMNGDGQIDVIAASRDDYTITLYHQIRTHKALLARGSTLVISSDLLQATDVDNTPAELIFTVSDIPNFGQLQLNSVPLAHNGTFTQADINNNSVLYVHNGVDTKSDSFNFTLIDGGQDGVRPGKGNFTLNIEVNPLTKVISDDFNASSLNQSLWTFVNPLMDAVLTMPGTQASIFVPAGTSHDVWYSNLAPRIMQNVSNTDFDVEAKFESVMNSQYQVQGLIVQQDTNNFLRFDFVRDALNTRIFAASFNGGSPSVRSDLVIPHGSPLYIRINRQGDQWTQSYSYDGDVFMNAAIFNHAITVGSVGIFVGNHGIPASSSPAFTGVIDYFFNTASPIIMEDGGNFQDPDISKQPLNRKVDVGMTATFSVVATGTIPLSYQWQKNGTDISGAMNPSYTTPPTTILDNGSTYRVNVSNSVGSVMSNSAILTISPITAPTIITQPSNQTVTVGQNATFSVLAAGTAPLSYQWQKNNTDIPGATSSLYTTPATNMSDNGSTYRVNITNLMGSVMSDQAKLIIRPFFNLFSDDFNTVALNASLWTVVNPRGDATISIIGTGTQDAMLSIAVPQGQEHDIWIGNNAPRVMQSVSNTNFEIEVKFQSQLTSGYQMQGVIVQQDANNYLRFDFVRFPGSTNIFAASFAAGSPYTRYNVPIDSGNPLYMRINRTAEQWKQFYSYDGSNWILAANFNYPMIVSSVGPFAGNALGSSSPAFTGLIDYFFDTSSPIVPEDSGNFNDIIISIQPINQEVEVGGTASFRVVATGTAPLSYQWQKNDTIITGATSATYTILSTNLSDNGSIYRVNITNPSGSVLSNSATLTVLQSVTLPTITTQPFNQTVTTGQNATFSVIAIGSSPLSYQWQKNGTNIPGATNASYTTPLTNMSYNRSTYRVNVSNAAGSVLSNSATLTVISSDIPPTITAQPSNQTVTTGQNATFSVVATGSSPLSYQWRKNGTNIPGATSASYTTPLTNMSYNGSTYRVRVSNAAGNVLSNSARLTVISSIPPTITTQPLNQTVTTGQNATFSVVATGSSPLSYQWQKNGTNILGATNASYTTPLTNMSYNRSTYRVNVSNAAGSVLSNSATLTVLQSVTPPTITTQPLNQTVTAGQNVTFVVVATGSSPLSYQWQKNGTNIPGAISSSYTTIATTIYDNGSTYRVNITNSAGSVMSDLATLTVRTPLTIISDDFNSLTLNTSIWTIIDPRNDSKFTLIGNGTHNALLSITVPAGISHDAWTGGNYAPRIMQSVNNTNFEIEVKFQSQMTSQYQIQGLIIQQDSNNYLRFDFVRNSATINIFAASFMAGYPTVKYDAGITTRTPLYLRINRTGNQWKQFYSYNGITWIPAANFNHSLTVTSAGPYVGNHGIPQSSSPTFTGLIDYFFNTSSPVIPEDVPDTTSPITLWYGNPQRFGQMGVPQQWVNILGNADNEYGIATMNYSLNNGSVSNLSLGPESNRLESIGDFNIEINHTDLLCGDNRVAINATDNAGNTKMEIVSINYSCNNIWPENYSINWSNVTNIQDVAQVVDGLWTRESNSIRPTIIGYDRLINIGDLTWDDYEITVPVTLNAPLDPSAPHAGPNFGVGMRWQGHYTWPGNQQPREGWYPLGALGVYIWAPELNDFRLRIIGNGMNVIANDNSGRHLSVGVPYMFKMKAQTIGANTLYSLKVWEQNTNEPTAWTISGYGGYGELKHGSALLNSHYANVSYGNVSIRSGPFENELAISDVSVEVNSNSATVNWNTNKQASSNVSYGLSTAYENGSVFNGTMVLSHTILLDGLKPGTNYHYKVNSTDLMGSSSSSEDMNFTTMPVVNITSITSDDFNTPGLDTSRWMVVNPKGDAIITIIGNGTSNALLSIAVPGGQEHDVWQGNNAPRIMQSISNTNFEVELKFQSQPTSSYQIQGVIIQQDNNNYLRFDFVRFPTSTNVFAASFSGGSPTTRYNTPITAGNPMFLRVNRTGTLWKQFYSIDGTNWIAAANFNYPLIVSSIGPFAGNAAGSSSPAFTGLVDYFFNTSSPVVPEDGGN